MAVQSPTGRRMVSHVREWVATAMRLHIYLGLVKSALCFGAQQCALCDPMDCCLPGSSVCGISNNWSRLPFPTPRDLPDPVIKPASLFSTNTTWALVHKLRKTEPSFSLLERGVTHMEREKISINLAMLGWNYSKERWHLDSNEKIEHPDFVSEFQSPLKRDQESLKKWQIARLKRQV